MMRKGELPVPYIIALILGIVVVGILGYGFFVLGWQIPGVSGGQQCTVKATAYCTQWARSLYDPAQKPDSDNWDSYAPGCRSAGVLEPKIKDCRTMTGTGAAGTLCRAGVNDDCAGTLTCQDANAKDSSGNEIYRCA